MFFKDELPPPRYALDGDLDDSELPYSTSYAITNHTPDLTKFDLVLLAPRCSAVLTPELGLDAQEYGRIEIESETTMRSESTANDFYEVEADVSDFKNTKHWTISFHPLNGTSRPTVVATLPAMNEAEAAYTGKQLVQTLKPARIVLVTPGQSFMDTPICYLETSEGSKAGEFSGLPSNIRAADPPVIVQGVGAACVSRAQQMKVPALALVLSADGPPNHEIVERSSLDSAYEALSSVLGRKESVRKGVEKGISELYV